MTQDGKMHGEPCMGKGVIHKRAFLAVLGRKLVGGKWGMVMVMVEVKVSIVQC